MKKFFVLGGKIFYIFYNFYNFFKKKIKKNIFLNAMSCKYFYFSSISTFFLEKVKKCKKILPPRAKDFLKIGHFSGHFYFYFFQENIKNVSIIHHNS